MATEELYMEIQSLIFSSTEVKLKRTAEWCKVDVKDKSKMALAREVSQSLEESLLILKDGEVIPYLQDLNLMLKDGKCEEGIEKIQNPVINY